jgi:nucleoside-diphosphate-sugar epimerase
MEDPILCKSAISLVDGLETNILSSVLNAGKHGKIGTYIIFPSGIYGEAAGPIPAHGVIQFVYREKAKELGFVPYIGEGTAVFNSLHIAAVTPFVLQVLDLALKEATPQGSVYERCFLIGGRETRYKDIAEAFAEVLYNEGVISSPVAKSVERKDAGEGELPMLMSSDMRFVSNRAKKLGYKNEEVSLVQYLRGKTSQKL